MLNLLRVYIYIYTYHHNYILYMYTQLNIIDCDRQGLTAHQYGSRYWHRDVYLMAALDGDCPDYGRKAKMIDTDTDHLRRKVHDDDWWREGWPRQWKVTTTSIMPFPASLPRGQNCFPLDAGDLELVEGNALPLPPRKSAACRLTSRFPQRQLLQQCALGDHLRTWKTVHLSIFQGPWREK